MKKRDNIPSHKPKTVIGDAALGIRPDKFEVRDDVFYCFPCYACKHVTTEEIDFCRGCIHYAQ